MHYYQHNINDYLAATTHLSLLEHGVYFRLLQHYYTKESGFSEDDLTTVKRRLSIRSTEEQQAFANVLADFFDFDGEYYTHGRCEAEIEEYREKLEQASRAGKASAEARRKKSTKGKRKPNAKASDVKQPANDSNDSVDTDSQPSNHDRSTEIERSFNGRSTTVQPTNNQEPLTNNQEPNINNSLSKTREENFEAEKICDQKSQDINDWSPPSLKTMQDTLTMAGCSWQLTQSEYDLHVSDFKAHYAEQALIGKGLVTESRRVSKLRKWLQDEYVKQQRQSKKSERFNIDNEDWGSVGKRPAANTNDDIPDVYHASHSKPTQQAKADPKLNVMVNGLWREPLPGLTVAETYEYIKQHQNVGELADEAYDRLLNELQEAV